MPKSYGRGRFSTDDLIELSNLDQLLLIFKVLFILFYKHKLNEEVYPQLVFLAKVI
jgi:hypothetical protein